MTQAFVLGNGISRQGIDLQQLQLLGTVYGCNALHREFTPDVLVATDRPIATHIQESGYSAEHRFHTRRPLPGLGAQGVPKPYFGFSSGPIATGLAAQDGHTQIYLLGFDMGPTENNTINNLYAGTEFYKRTDAPPTFTGNWIKQLCRIARDHSSVQFVRVRGATTAPIPELNAVPNFTHVDLSTFVDRINNKKDL
jgi:hypothetical protein